MRAGITYSAERADVSLAGRWFAAFFWASGPFVGEVESFATFDLTAGYRLGDRWRFGIEALTDLSPPFRSSR